MDILACLFCSDCVGMFWIDLVVCLFGLLIAAVLVFDCSYLLIVLCLLLILWFVLLQVCVWVIRFVVYCLVAAGFVGLLGLNCSLIICCIFCWFGGGCWVFDLLGSWCVIVGCCGFDVVNLLVLCCICLGLGNCFSDLECYLLCLPVCVDYLLLAILVCVVLNCYFVKICCLLYVFVCLLLVWWLCVSCWRLWLQISAVYVVLVILLFDCWWRWVRFGWLAFCDYLFVFV